MITLVIRKKSANDFWHYPNDIDGLKFAISDFDCSIYADVFIITQRDGARGSNTYFITDITFYDETGVNTAETFTDAVTFWARMRAVNYTPFLDANSILPALQNLAELNCYTNIAGTTLVGQILTFLTGWAWKIAGLPYSNAFALPFTINYCAAGKSRFDLFVANNANGFTQIFGVETDSTPVEPTTPIGTLKAVAVLVTDSAITISSTANTSTTPNLEQVLLVNDRPIINVSFTDIKSNYGGVYNITMEQRGSLIIVDGDYPDDGTDVTITLNLPNSGTDTPEFQVLFVPNDPSFSGLSKLQHIQYASSGSIFGGTLQTVTDNSKAIIKGFTTDVYDITYLQQYSNPNRNLEFYPTQSGTDAPTIVIRNNPTAAILTAEYVSVGTYDLVADQPIFANSYPNDDTSNIPINLVSDPDLGITNNLWMIYRISPTRMRFRYIYDFINSNIPVDGYFTGTILVTIKL